MAKVKAYRNQRSSAVVVMGCYFLELWFRFYASGVAPLFEGQLLLGLSWSLLYLSGQVLFVVLFVGTVAHFFSVYGYSCWPVFYSGLSLVFYFCQGFVLEQGKFLALLGAFSYLCFLFLLFFRLAYFPDIKGLEWFKLLQIEFGMSAVAHMLLHTILRLKFVLAVYAVSTFDPRVDILE